MSNDIVELDLGDLCVDLIHKTLGIELEPGKLVFTRAAQIHSRKNHPHDYGRCLPHVGPVVTSPLYMGDDFKNPDKIEFVSRVPALGSGLLIAIVIVPDDDGHYRVASMYPISETTIEGRRQKGHLKRTALK